jgi:hypothetical protein
MTAQSIFVPAGGSCNGSLAGGQLEYTQVTYVVGDRRRDEGRPCGAHVLEEDTGRSSLEMHRSASVNSPTGRQLVSADRACESVSARGILVEVRAATAAQPTAATA